MALKYLIMGSYLTCPDEAEDYFTEIPLLCCDTLDEAQKNLDILHRKLVDTGRRMNDGSEEIENSLPETLWIYTIPNNIDNVEMDIDPYDFN